jgi:hypothetical protein
LKFHNRCRWCHVPCKEFFCPRYTWRDRLYSFWNVKLCCIIQRVVPHILHTLLHFTKLQPHLINFTNFMSQYRFIFILIPLLNIQILMTIVCSYLILNNLLTNFESVQLEKIILHITTFLYLKKKKQKPKKFIKSWFPTPNGKC